ncbi:MAG: DUF695 domain-containing protein, partial [Muribaculaceae bacterium]|nr:DUF695 domain-containing protein [Muribaculaceae bacterium]
ILKVAILISVIVFLVLIGLSACKIHKHNTGQKEYQVTLPGEMRFSTATFEIDGMPHVGVFNTAILELEPKEVFRWFLSMQVKFDETVGDDMPTNPDVVRMQDFSDLLTDKLAGNPSHPNALFLGRVTGMGETMMMWYVNNPEIAHNYLQGVIESEEYPFHFKYEMVADPKWENAQYWLKPLLKK